MSFKSSSSRGSKRSAGEASLAEALPAGDLRKIVAASRTQKGAPRHLEAVQIVMVALTIK